MMMMFFHGGVTEVILFDTWRIDSVGGLIGSMIACFFMGILYEGIKFFRWAEKLLNKNMEIYISKFYSSREIILRGNFKQVNYNEIPRLENGSAGTQRSTVTENGDVDSAMYVKRYVTLRGSFKLT